MAEISPVSNLDVSANSQIDSYYTRLMIGEYPRRDNAFKLGEFKPTLTLFLPLPTELRDDTTVSYNPVNLETVGDALSGSQDTINAALLRNAGNIINSALSAGQSAITGASRNAGIAGKIAGAMGGGLVGAVQSLLPPEQINSAIQQQIGAAPNPNPSVQFLGPVLRDFTYSWAFYPKNKEESARIDDMIRKLKGRALPSRNRNEGGGKGPNASILNYPHICQLNFFPWDGIGEKDDGVYGWSKNSIIKIKRCFMAGVNVNYNAFGTPAFFEGTKLPISYQLTINFKEIEYLLSEDWDSSAASERTTKFVNGLDAIKTSGALVIKTGYEIAEYAVTNLPQYLLGEESDAPPTQEETDRVATAEKDTTALESGKSNSYIQLEGTTVKNYYTIGKTAEGKYEIRTFQPDDIVATTKDGKTTYSVKQGERGGLLTDAFNTPEDAVKWATDNNIFKNTQKN